MCEVSEKIYREGIEAGQQEGRLQSQKETAINMAKMGMPSSIIAQALKVGEDVVKNWLCAIKSCEPR